MPGQASPKPPCGRPSKHLARGLVAGVAALAMTGPALGQSGRRSHEALHQLIPLIEVYGLGATATPEFDVAGIRCGGLVMAQDEWARRNRASGVRRVSAATLRSVEHTLTAAEITRRNRGMSLPDAYEATRTDLRRVIGLYIARFNSNAQGGHPWNNDPMLHGDIHYCQHVIR